MLDNGLKQFEIAFIIAFVSFFNFINGIEYPIDTTKYEFAACKTSDDLDGECRRLNDCPSGKIKFQKSDLCSYLKEVPLYCCVTNKEKIPIVSTEQNSTVVRKRFIDRICDKYYPSLSEPLRSKRFVPEPRPHMTAIGWTNVDGIVEWLCGGSLITEKFVLTAAHCTDNRGVHPDKVRPGGVKILVTKNDIFPEDRNITAVYKHPEYKRPALYHDIGLLRISPDLTVTAFLRPACLWNSDVIPVNELLAMGYGATSFGGQGSNVLLEGSLTLLSQEECTKRIGTRKVLPNGIIMGQLCAEDPNHIKDTCQGDSGGPLQFDHRSGGTRRPVIVGITSFGIACGSTYPGGYTRVSTYLDWIESIILPKNEARATK